MGLQKALYTVESIAGVVRIEVDSDLIDGRHCSQSYR